jgi:hypothetical protein
LSIKQSPEIFLISKARLVEEEKSVEIKKKKSSRKKKTMGSWDSAPAAILAVWALLSSIHALDIDHTTE